MGRWVVHCKRAPYDVYIGRPSKWGNPYRLIRESEREAILVRYREWLNTQPELLEAVYQELRGKVLGCWCAPKLCHGDILAEIANGPRYDDVFFQGLKLLDETG